MTSKKQSTVQQSDEWLTTEDVERDLWAFSEYTHYQDFEPAPPKTILEWRNRKGQNNTKSIFDREIPEDVEYFVSGRGRAIPHRIVRPGEQIAPHARDFDELRRQIRETSGIGYRNDIIEQTLAKNRMSPQNFVPHEKIENLDLAPMSDSGSGTSTPSRNSARNVSPRTSPALFTNGSRWVASPTNKQSVDIRSKEEFPPLKSKQDQ